MARVTLRFGSLVRFFILAFCWGSSFLWIKIALTGLSPIQITFGRLILGTAVMVGYCATNQIPLPHDRRTWLLIAVPALTGAAIPFTLFGIGEQRIDSNLAGVLVSTIPVFTAVLSMAVGLERKPGRIRGAGIAIGFVGAAVILAPWQATGHSSLAGSLICLASAALYAISFIFIGRFLVKKVEPAPLVAGQLLVASILVGFCMPFVGRQPVDLNWAVSGAVLTLGIAGTGLAYLLNTRMIAEDGPTLAATVSYLVPVISVLLGATILTEDLRLETVLGMLTVLGGIALSRHQPSGRQQAKATEGRSA